MEGKYLSRNVVIVESPAKAKTIEKYLGKDFKVLASYGHIRDLPSKDGSVDPENDFSLNYVVPKESQKHIKAIVDAVKKADGIYLATDLDREGEAISWHVLDELESRLKGLGDKTIHRIEFTEITKAAIQNAVANPRELAMNMVDAQQARRALDYLVGFTLSPVLWRKVRGGLSAGRVQSVALRLICEREAEIEAFVPQEYWSVQGLFDAAGTDLPGKLWQYNGEKVEKFSFTNEEQIKDVVANLEGQTYSVSALEQKNSNRRPAPPFITSTLQWRNYIQDVIHFC
jgi:DNA topoisomerase-1